MEEMKKDCGCQGKCEKVCSMFTCGTGGGCGHGNSRFVVVRWILAALILMITFSIGMRIGEFKGEIERASYSRGGGYGYPMMMNPNIYQ